MDFNKSVTAVDRLLPILDNPETNRPLIDWIGYILGCMVSYTEKLEALSIEEASKEGYEMIADLEWHSTIDDKCEESMEGFVFPNETKELVIDAMKDWIDGFREDISHVAVAKYTANVTELMIGKIIRLHDHMMAV